MRKTMEDFLKANDMCVLATSAGDRPHCSLMAYATPPDGRELYMVTPKDSMKYANLTRNPQVSLLVDSRITAPREKVQALTVEGVFEKTEDPMKRKAILDLLGAVHPQLKGFMENPIVEPLCFRIVSFLFLDGIETAFFEQVDAVDCGPPG
jgi:nitroimidazol reductase NimA-like FMN-containing flavoprotein (pyridoxamine 5'-phosphate oxidase superfamily)